MKTHFGTRGGFACGTRIVTGFGTTKVRDVDCVRCKATEVYQLALGAAVMATDVDGEALSRIAVKGGIEFDVDAELAGSEPWEMPAFMKVDAVDALSALTLFEHLRNDGVPGFDAMRSVLAADREAL